MAAKKRNKKSKPRSRRERPEADSEKATSAAAPLVSSEDDGASEGDGEIPSRTDSSLPAASIPEVEKQKTATRRGFIGRAGQIFLGCGGLAAAVGAVRFALPGFEMGRVARFPLGRLSDFKMNTLTWLRERDLFVMRREEGIGAFSAKCTHLGCTVRRSEEGFVCPCHGATYGPEGRVVSGPARRDLPWFRVWLETDGRLWVDSEIVARTNRPTPLARPPRDRG